ncbi:MAG: BRCT domain-containing protein [Desulfoplanes sp.]
MPDIHAINTLTQQLQKYNAAYRAGHPLVSDEEYDNLVESLRTQDPDNPFLNQVEPEIFSGKKQVRHPVPMLSTDKAYTKEDLQRFVDRVHKEGAAIGIHAFRFRVTPKLDGLAGRDDGTTLATRGNGMTGFEINSALTKGVIPVGGRGLGLGELVIQLSYFQEHLADKFEHPRNLVVGIISSDTVNTFAQQALEDKAVRFVPYTTLPFWEGNDQELLASIDDIKKDLQDRVDYPIDGLVVEVTNEDLKTSMGATAHHYRWQIAVKDKGETAETRVKKILWQVGRTGKVTPVLLVEPISLSGATIRRVTAHNAGFLKKRHAGEGALIEIIRSGEVIPKLEAVITGSDKISLPTICPVCSMPLIWENDFLVCTNTSCPAQIRQRIEHWFKILGNADWYGTKTVEKLVNQGVITLEAIYALAQEDFENMGFGPVQSRNLFQALAISKNTPVEDWRFLAAFGIADLGKGDSRKLLAHHPIDTLTDITPEEILDINGFGDITCQSISRGIAQIRTTIEHMLDLGFNLERTPRAKDLASIQSPLTGKGIVFTGKMLQGTREEMQELARKLGAKVQTSVTGATDYLVCGEKVGAKKIATAKEKGTKVISEQEFMEIVTTKERRKEEG